MAEAAPPQTALVRRARRINRELARLYPDARIELHFTSPLELLVAAILAAHATDHQVNQVSQVLFARYRTAADYAAADRAELEAMIHPTGYFRAKTNTLISLGQALCERFGGEVPGTLDDLVTLPGVGRKTANMVLRETFRKPAGYALARLHAVRVVGERCWWSRGRPGGALLVVPREAWRVFLRDVPSSPARGAAAPAVRRRAPRWRGAGRARPPRCRRRR